MNHISVETGLIYPTDIYNLISFDPHKAFGEWDGISTARFGVKVVIDAVKITGDEILNAILENVDVMKNRRTLVRYKQRR